MKLLPVQIRPAVFGSAALLVTVFTLAQAQTGLRTLRSCEVLVDRPSDTGVLQYRGEWAFAIRIDHRRHRNGLVAYDSNCRLRFDRILEHPEASEVRVYDAAVLGGGVVAAGWIQDRLGRTAGVLWMLDASGEVRSLVRTNPFHGTLVAVDAQQRIWVLGVDLEKNDRATDLPVLQCFRADGTKLDEYLPRGTFPRRGAPPANVTADGVPLLAAGDDWVGVYSPHYREWIEITPSSRTVSRMSVPVPLNPQPLAGRQSLPFASGAVSDRREVFGWFPGGGLYQLDRQARAWIARPEGEGLAGLRGAAGDVLVGLRKSPRGNHEFVWLQRE